jgi:lysozyme
MKTAEKGIELLKELEGFSAKPYQCVAGIWTIGYGSTRFKGAKIHPNMVITIKEAEEQIKDDVLLSEQTIERLVKVALNQNQFDALVCFVYNIGVGAFENSTLLKKLNQSLFQEVSFQLKRWNKVRGVVIKGLTTRRNKEIELFLTPVIEPSLKQDKPILEKKHVSKTSN